jgi:hypothetical protein
VADQTPHHPTTAPAEPLPSREQLVASAADGWARELADLGGRDPLRDYRDLALGSLDLTHAHPSGLAMLFAGRPTRLSDLVREPGALAEARRKARAVAGKAAELSAERGLTACWLAVGIATWTSPGAARPPAAPVLLRSCVLRPRGVAEDDFDIDLGADLHLNPALVGDVGQHGARLDPADVVSLALTAARFDPAPALDRVARACAAVPGFRLEHRLVLSTFSAAPLLLAADLDALGPRLAEHDVVAALAGDRSALPPTGGPVVKTVTDPDPRAELLVLDADSDQQAVLDAVRAGSHLLVQAPPGTGRSQTIANLVAALAADGRRTLLVAQKRAAVVSVLERLGSVGLADLVLDLPDGGSARERVAAEVAARVDGVAVGSAPDEDAVLRTLVDRRDRLSGHVEALHAPRAPWGVSAYDAQLALAALTARRPAPRSRVRVRGEALARLTRAEAEELSVDLTAAAAAGAFEHAPDDDPWFGADLLTAEAAQGALRSVTELAATRLPRARQRVASLLSDAGLPPGATVAEWGEHLTLVASVRQTLEVFATSVWDTSLDDAVAATASAEWRDSRGISMDWWERRGLVRQARQLLRPGPPPEDLHTALALAQEQRRRWQELAGPGSRPRVPAGLSSAQQAYDDVVKPLRELGPRLAGTTAGGDLLAADVATLAGRLEHLRESASTLEVVPQRARLRERLVPLALDALLADLADRRVAAEDVGAELELVWWTSVLEHVAATDPRYGQHDGELLRTMALEYAAADRQHVAAGASRVRLATANRLVEALGDHPEQGELLRSEAERPRGHRSLLELTAECPDVLAAATPCWAVSPLAVPQVVGPQVAFDVVVVDEASQLLPAAAVTALARGRQVVVVGDDRQLPPAGFSVTVAPAEADSPSGVGSPRGASGAPGTGAEAASAGKPVSSGAPAQQAAGGSGSASAAAGGPASVLEALSGVLPRVELRTQYRCLDEALVAFADERVYGGRLRTLPAAGEPTSMTSAADGADEAGTPAVRLDVVPGSGDLAPGEDGIDSTDAEVERVVELVLQHARTRREESLGVVTLGRRHAQRVAEALRVVLPELPDVAAVLAPDVGVEPFFVKAVDDAQGDTRDAVVLSVGYGRTPHGRVLHRFGALGEPGGERRLAVAATRARRRMTVVSAFGASELDPARLTAEGPRLLRDLLAACEAAAQPAGPAREDAAASAAGPDTSGAPTEPDALLQDLASRLRAQGLRVAQRYGRSGSGIDLAVGEEGGPLLVAVEGDGPAYAAVASTRDRDRLRVEHLQRLGWTHLRIWTTDVFRDPAREVARVVSVVRAAAARDRQRRAGAVRPSPVADWARVRWDGDRAVVAPSAQPAVLSGTRPSVPTGRPIEEYSPEQLDDVVRWICADTLARTDEQVAALARQHLGFVRRGARVDAALAAAIARVTQGAVQAQSR